MLHKPFSHRFSQRSGEPHFTGGHTLAHLARHFEHIGVFAAMTTTRRKRNLRHPAFFLTEVFLGVDKKGVKAGEQIILAGGTDAVQQLDKLAMRFVHRGLVDGQLVRPFKQGLIHTDLRFFEPPAYQQFAAAALDAGHAAQHSAVE